MMDTPTCTPTCMSSALSTSSSVSSASASSCSQSIAAPPTTITVSHNKKSSKLSNIIHKFKFKRTTQWDNPIHTIEFIKLLCKEVENQRFDDQQKVLDSALAESRDRVLKVAEEKRIEREKEMIHQLQNNELKQQGYNSTSSSCSDACSNSTMIIYPQLPSLQQNARPLNSGTGNNHNITFKQYAQKSFKPSQSIPPLYIEGTHNPRPLSTATIFLKKHYAAEDQKELTFLPYFGDLDTDKEIEDIQDLFDLERRERMVENGPEYIQEEIDNAIKDVLDLLYETVGSYIAVGNNKRRKVNNNAAASTNARAFTGIEPSILNNLHSQIAHIKGVEKSKIDDIYNRCYNADYQQVDTNQMKDYHPNKNKKGNRDEDDHDGRKKDGQQQSHQELGDVTTTSPRNSDANFAARETTHYEDVMDSFRSLFCRQCLVYDCNLHGNLPPPNLAFQTKLAIEKDKENELDVKEDPPSFITKCLPCHDELLDNAEKREEFNVKESIIIKPWNTDTSDTCNTDQRLSHLSPLQKVICEHAFQIFRGDVEQMATVFGTNTKPIQEHIQETNIILHCHLHSHTEESQKNIADPKRKKLKIRLENKAMKYYNPVWLKRVQNAEIHPAFYPCSHEEPCSDDTCTCVQNAFFCTKHCVWGSKSRNMFKGCMCNSQCNTNNCPCFAAQRECDPDLCRNCQSCSDPPNRPASTQRCRNDNISMRRHTYLLLAESGVENAGWGIYNKYFLKRGSFVHEYVGEMISQEEAERRGVLYDKMNRSYLFNLTSDTVVDASRKGNKMKFANHSTNKPNCYAKILTVNGDRRIGLFAKEDIEPQTELLFDYAYDLCMSNDLIEKSGVVLEWMKSPSMGKKASKKRA